MNSQTQRIPQCCINTEKPTELLKRSWRTGITVDYPEGINTHKTHRRPACPRTGGLKFATPGPPAAAVQQRLAAEAAVGQHGKTAKRQHFRGRRAQNMKKTGVAEKGLFGADRNFEVTRDA